MSADTRKVVASNTYFSLHTHSRYSVNDAMSGIGALVDQAVALGYPALGLTDHGTMAGVGQLYRLGKKAQLPVLPGIEMYLTPHHEAHTRSSMHLTMVAYTSVGYRNLVALSNQAQRQFYYRPRLDLADLAAAAEAGLTSGIAVATGCRSGPVVKSLTERGDPAGARQIVLALAAWFPRVYVELMDHGFTADGMWDYEINDALAAIACETGVPMILTGDAHYTLVADREDHDALKTLVSWSTEPDGGTFSGEGYWLMSQAEMAAKAVWQRYDVQTGLVELAAAAKVAIPELDTFTLKIPDVTLRGEQDIALGIKVKAGFARNMAHLLGPRRKRYQDRLDTELDVIAATGMAGYLLLVALITDYMERSDIWFHTRGSAAGSLACYVLGITQVDPIAEDIRMDRFLSGDRTSVPDVDLDIEHTKRDRVVAFLEGRGYELLQVGTQPVYGLDVRDNDESGEEKGSLRVKYFSTLRKQGIDIKGWAGVPAGDKATLARLADRGLIAGVGAHPGGYIIAKDAPTVAAIPMTKIASSGTTVTSWDKGEVEAAGFPKIDLLGSKALTGIRLCCEMVTGSQHAPTLDAPVGSSQAGADVWQSAKEYYRAIPRDDKATLKRCAEGHTVGLFQLGGWTQRRGVIDLKPKSTKDLIAAQALFRPAPLQSGFTKSYLRRRDKLDQVPDMHADISDETAGTYGIALYQEQVIGILRRIGLAPKDLTKMLKAVKSSGRAGEAAAKVAVAEEIDTIVAMATGRGWMPHDIRYLERALLDYGAGYCVTGDTVLWRSSGGRYSPQTMTVRELYDVWHGPSTPARKKYRAAGRGLTVLARDAADGRVRPDRVLDVVYQGERPVWTVRLESGHEITSTENHKHATDRGWRRVNQLEVGDLVAVMGEPEPWHAPRPTGEPQHLKNGRKQTRLEVRDRWICEHCELVPGAEIAHLDQDTTNNTLENLAWLCLSCHRTHDHAAGSLKIRHSRGRPVFYSPVVAFVDAGVQSVYDLSMAGEDHSWVANGIITSNSFGKAHSVTYGLVAYCTAFLATHEPLAYWTGMLNAYLGAKNSKGDKLEPFYIKAARTDEVRVRNPHVNHSGVAYLPEAGDGGLSIRTGLVSILGCGIGASNELVAKQPFRDLVDIGQRVTGKVSGAKDLLTGVPPAECKGVIAALFEAGALAGLAPGEPVVKAVTSRKRRCEECKITYATPIELTAHQASEHPEHQESA